MVFIISEDGLYEETSSGIRSHIFSELSCKLCLAFFKTLLDISTLNQLSFDSAVSCIKSIGEYSATKIYFFPGRRKNCEKVSPYFSLSGVEKFPNLHFGGKLQILWGKSIKIGIYWQNIHI